MNRRITFQQQAGFFMKYAATRTRRPMKPATLRGFKSYLHKWLLPALGGVLVADVNNGRLRSLVSHMHTSGLSAKSIDTYVGLVKLIVASAVDEEGEEIFPRKWNADSIGMPVVKYVSQPTVTGETVSRLIAATDGQYRVLFALLASTGLRVGEAFGLEVGKHLSTDCQTLYVRQSVWCGAVQSPKTENAIRDVDLYSGISAMLRELVGSRTSGFLFQARNRSPLHQSNIIRRVLHPKLAELNSPKVGFHAFRRFRVTHLRKLGAPEDLLRGWLGHSALSLTDRYCKLGEDIPFRKQTVEHLGVGFDLPTREIVVSS